MDGSIRLSAQERKILFEEVRRGIDPGRRLRAHILVLLNDGIPCNTIIAVLFTSTATINRWWQRYLAGGLSAVLESKCSRRSRWHWAIALVIHWVTIRSPRDFGFYRSRWNCGTIVALLEEDQDVRTSRETVRCWLHEEGLVWRRPRPALGPKDPQRSQKRRTIRALLRELPANETAFFQDEVDVNTNPKIGSMWMWRGQQAELETPGTNTKRYLAGSMNWRTGEVILSDPGIKRNADLFLRHLDDLRRRFRCYRRIHVICDNACFIGPTVAKRYKSTWPNGDTASFSIFCRPMYQKPTLLNGSGGICMNRSPAITAVRISMSCSISFSVGCQRHPVSRLKLPSTMPP
jgi:transposase